MKKIIPAIIALLFIPIGMQAVEKSFEKTLKPFLNDYCIKCHGPKKEKGDLRLDKLAFHLNDFDNVEQWQYILDELNQANICQ